MKKYKLLQEIVWCNWWEIFLDDWTIERENKETTVSKISNNLKEIQIKALISVIDLSNTEWFEEMKEVKSIYDLKDWDIYFYINEVYRVCDCGFNKIESQHDLFFWNAFLTKEEAETELKKRKAMATIKKWSHDNNDHNYWFVIDSDNFVISYDFDYKALRVFSTDPRLKDWNTFYYTSKEIWERAIKELEAEYKIVFNIN